jgi:hypothetical protein
LLAKSTPHNVNLGSGRFAMFNNERDIPGWGRIVGSHPVIVACSQGCRRNSSQSDGALARAERLNAYIIREYREKSVPRRFRTFVGDLTFEAFEKMSKEAQPVKGN